MRLSLLFALVILQSIAFATENATAGKCRLQLSDRLHTQIETIATEGLREWKYPDVFGSSLSARKRQVLMDETAILYARASKNPAPDFLLSPRRALAAMIHSLSGTHLKLAQELEGGAEPLEAYDRYLKSIQRVYAPYLKTQPYTAEQVADVASLAIQKSEFEKIEIFGSFPNGRANFSSFDVDIYAFESTRFFKDMRSRIVSGQRINEAIKSYFERLEIPIQEQGISYTGFVSLDQMTRARPYFSYLFEGAALSSPVSVFANRREIRLRIYPRPAARGQAPREYFLRRIQ